MAVENAKQREIRLRIEELVQEHAAAHEDPDPGLVGGIVLEVATVAYLRSPNKPIGGGYYLLICDPATGPHSTAGLLDFGTSLADQDDDEDEG